MTDVHADLLRKRVRRGGRLAIFVSDLHRRPTNLLGDIGLRSGKSGGNNSESPRRIQMGENASWLQALALQQPVQALPQFLRGGVDHSRRDFFATDFK